MKMEIAEMAEMAGTVSTNSLLGKRQWHGVSGQNRRWLSFGSTPATSSQLGIEMDVGSGGKMVVELVGAFNKLTKRMSTTTATTAAAAATTTPATSFKGESVVFEALKLSIPHLQGLPLLPGGRPALARALSVALLLADLRMDAEVVSAALLLHPLRSGRSLSLPAVRSRLGPGTAHLLHDSLRLSSALLRHDADGSSDDEASAAALRRYCLSLYDSRSVVLELALALDAMAHHLPHLPRYEQQRFSLRVLHLHAPLAHALALPLPFPLEDLAFRYLFPLSYLYLDAWLRSHDPTPLLDSCRELLLQALRADPELSPLVSDVAVAGRLKSRYSTMKKLLKDGRKPQDVNDVLGLRVVLSHLPRPHDRDGEAACYRAREVVRSLWGEVEGRGKDYVASPKPNGYRSLHMAVDVSDPGGGALPLVEIQIRTAEMDSSAAGGAASHSLYKAGLTDPREAMRLKAIMVAAAELAALRLEELPSATTGSSSSGTHKAFRLLDKNGDGRISIEELAEVMEELGAPVEDARHMMHLLDSNSDGSLSSDEFESFQEQIEFMRTLEDTDDRYKTMLNEKLQFEQKSE